MSLKEEIQRRKNNKNKLKNSSRFSPDKNNPYVSFETKEFSKNPNDSSNIKSFIRRNTIEIEF